MADLLTTIGLSDEEFRKGLSRVEARLSGYSASVKDVSRVSKGLFTGFGTIGAVTSIISVVDAVRQAGEEADKAKQNFYDLAQAALDAGNAKKASFGKTDPIQGERDRVNAEIKKIEGAANTEIERLSGMSEWERFKYEMANGWKELTEEAIQRITNDKRQKVAALNANSKEIEKTIKDAAVRQRIAQGEQDYKTSSQSYQQYYGDLSRQAEAARRMFSDDSAMLLEAGGDTLGAEAARAAERRRQRIREMEDNDTLSADQKRLSAARFGGMERLENLQAEAKFLAQQEESAMRGRSFSGSTGGSTFGQQVAGISSVVAETKKQTELQEKISELIQTLSSDLKSRSFSAWN